MNHIAIFHCPIQIINRSIGKSAVAAAAYRSGERLTNEWDGESPRSYSADHSPTETGWALGTEVPQGL